MAIMMVMMMMVHIKHIIFPVIQQEKSVTDQFRYIKIHTWLRGLGDRNKRNVLFIAEPQDDFFCFLFYPPSLAAKYDFTYISKLVYLFDKLNPANYVYASVI